MSLFKKYAWYGSAVAVAALMAVALLGTTFLGTAEANALAITRTPTSVAPSGTSTVTVFAEDGDGPLTVVASTGTLTNTSFFLATGTGTQSMQIFDAANVIDGGVDVNNDGAITAADDCSNCLNVAGLGDGVVDIINGAVDVNEDGVIDATDDAANVLLYPDAQADLIDGFWDVDESAAVDAADDAAVNQNLQTTTFTYTAPATGPATATITAIQDNVSQSTTVTIQGPATTIALVALENPSTSTTACVGQTASVIRASGATTGDQTASICVKATDAAGNAVATNTNVVITTTEGTLSGNSALTNASGVGEVTLTANATAVAGDTATITASSGNATATTTVMFGGDPASCTVSVTPNPAQTGVTATISVDVNDTGGFAVPDDEALPGVATQEVTIQAVFSGTGQPVAVVGGGTNVPVENGVATAQILSAQTGTIGIVATSEENNEVSCSTNLTVEGAAPTPTPGPTETPPAGGDAQFDRPIDDIGVNTAVWGGGTVTQLSAATAAAGGISVTVFVGGDAKVLIPGAPAFVNAEFNAAFPTGNVPAGTIVLVVR